jgi:hypothetical protein
MIPPYGFLLKLLKIVRLSTIRGAWIGEAAMPATKTVMAVDGLCDPVLYNAR